MFLAVVVGYIAPAAAASRVERDITVDGLNRRYVAYLPEGYRQKGALPVVLAFHGAFGDPDQLARLTGLASAPQAKNFTIVYPQGYKRTWNAGSCCGAAMREHIDDGKFVRALLNDLGALTKIDRRRIYATGYSNGGALSYYLACTMSQEIAAIAPVSGVMRYPKSECHPARPVPVLEFHGLQDHIASYMGGTTTATGLEPQPPVPETIAFWTSVDGAKNVSHVNMFGAAAECDIYSGERDGAKVEQCRIPNMGHRWPGSHSTPATERGDAIIKSFVGDLGPYAPSVDANDAILQFFNEFTLPSAPNP
ncbi:MAG: PHB depolymerase family esterase [Methylocella sp.]